MNIGCKLCDLCTKKVKDVGKRHCICLFRGKTRKRHGECEQYINKNTKPVSMPKINFVDAVCRGLV